MGVMAECKHMMDPPEACADCHPPEVPAPRPARWGPWFTAERFGACQGCPDGIFPGDTIRSDGQDGYLCENCGREVPV
jgi:hypothetical protein